MRGKNLVIAVLSANDWHGIKFLKHAAHVPVADSDFSKLVATPETCVDLSLAGETLICSPIYCWVRPQDFRNSREIMVIPTPTD